MMGLPKRKIERILVIHTAFLGDIVLTTPFFAALRRAYPQAEILFVTTPVGASIMQPNPFQIQLNIFAKRSVDSGLRGTIKKIKELKKFHPSVVFCLHRSFRSAVLARGVSKEVWGFSESPGKIFFRGAVSRKNILMEAEKNLNLLQEFLKSRKEDYLAASITPKLTFTREDEEKAKKILKGTSNFIALAPCSVWATKRWPADKFAQLALLFVRKYNISAVLIGGNDESDRAICQKIIEHYLENCSVNERGLQPLNLAGQTDLPTLKALLAKAKLVVSNDSAPLHIATAVGVPVHGIFGPTTESLGFFPHSVNSSVSQINELSCRPCGLHGHNICPKKHFRCMLDLDYSQVFQEAEKLLCP